MDAEEKRFIADMFQEAYKDMIGKPMQYVVVSGTRNAFNELIESYDESNATTVYGFISHLQAADPEIEASSTGRYDIAVTFVVTPLIEKGFMPKYGDAIDIIDALGNSVRYVVSGFQDKNENPEIFARLFATRKDKV